jgi:hypothetical protein
VKRDMADEGEKCSLLFPRVEKPRCWKVVERRDLLDDGKPKKEGKNSLGGDLERLDLFKVRVYVTESFAHTGVTSGEHF